MTIVDIATVAGASASVLTLLLAIYASWKVLLREGRNRRRVEAYLRAPARLRNKQNDTGKRTALSIAQHTGIPLVETEAALFRSKKIDIFAKVDDKGLVENLLYSYSDRPKRLERSSLD